MATRLRGRDTSYEGRMTQASRELQEAEERAQQAKKDLEYVLCSFIKSWRVNLLMSTIGSRHVSFLLYTTWPKYWPLLQIY